LDQATLRLRTRKQHARDGQAMLMAGARRSRESIATIERSRDILIQSRARLVLSRLRLDQSRSDSSR
jgi:hypothetical protein